MTSSDQSARPTCEQAVDASLQSRETQSIHILDHAGAPVLTFDADDYRQYVAQFDLSEDQETELLQAIWAIMVQFVDLGFGIEAVQQAIEPREDEQENKETDEEEGVEL